MGAGAEVANTERQKERERKKKGLESMREEDTTAAILRWIHTTNEGGTDFTQSRERQKEEVKSQKGDGNTGMGKKGLTIHKDTGWHFQVAAG